MNKKIATISLCISIILYGNTIDTNKIENLQPNIQKKETHTQENLDYLLEDSDTKFPVSDYIWQKGQQKQNIDKYFKDTQKKMEGEQLEATSIDNSSTDTYSNVGFALHNARECHSHRP